MFRPEFPPQESFFSKKTENLKTTLNQPSNVFPNTNLPAIATPTKLHSATGRFVIMNSYRSSLTTPSMVAEHGRSKCDCGVEDESFGGFSIDIEKIIT
ncbi:hypothetical protein L2E82_50609 [Cichorium intybus]|nr:hypothetical protein L2E82_50609 [Cichorium intybus]